MTSQASNIATSRPIKVGSALLEATQKTLYKIWTESTEAQLFEWLELVGNYEMRKGADIKNASGATWTSGLTKKAIIVTNSNFLNTLPTKKTFEQVMFTMRYVK